MRLVYRLTAAIRPKQILLLLDVTQCGPRTDFVPIDRC
jgi:hypothetical protein